MEKRREFYREVKQLIIHVRETSWINNDTWLTPPALVTGSLTQSDGKPKDNNCLLSHVIVYTKLIKLRGNVHFVTWIQFRKFYLGPCAHIYLWKYWCKFTGDLVGISAVTMSKKHYTTFEISISCGFVFAWENEAFRFN